MKANYRFAFALGMTACLLTNALGDEPRPAAPPTRQPAAHEGHNEHLDQQFAACLILDNQNEITLSKLAEQRSKSPEVKKFAQMLQKDHQRFISELEKFGGTRFQNRRPDSATAGTEEAKAQLQREETAAKSSQPRRTGEGNPGAVDHDLYMQIKHEIADECVATAQRELSGKEGREFDACFIGMQLAAHQKMVVELKVLERHASRELQGTLKKGRETAQSHLDRAKEIMKDIDRGDTRTTSK